MPSRTKRVCQPEVEVREIDHDQDVRAALARGPDQPAVHRVRPGQHPQRLDEARHGEAPVVADERRARRAQPVAAEPLHADVGTQRTQLARQRAGVQVAGRFAAGNENGRHGSYFSSALSNSEEAIGPLITTSFTACSRMTVPLSLVSLR